MSVRVLAISCEALDDAHRALLGPRLPADWECLTLDNSDGSYEGAMNEADAIVGWPPPELLACNTRVKLLQLPSAGFEDYAQTEIADTVVCNAAGVLAPAVAEHCVALMFAFARRLPEHVADTAARRWRRLSSYRELAGGTVCIIGLGDIGRQVATRCSALGLRVITVARGPRHADVGVDEVFGFERMPDALARADYVVVSLPGGEGTRGIVNASAISAIKPGSYLVNVGRGTTLDQPALIAALESGRLAGAGIDVWDPEPLDVTSPLWRLPNVVVTSHSAGLSDAVQGRLATLVADNVERFSRRLALRNQVIPPRASGAVR